MYRAPPNKRAPPFSPLRASPRSFRSSGQRSMPRRNSGASQLADPALRVRPTEGILSRILPEEGNIVWACKKVLLTVASSALAVPDVAQAPTAAFDGKHAGVCTEPLRPGGNTSGAYPGAKC